MRSHNIENIRHELAHLWTFALKLTNSKDSAEDLVQKTALRAIEKIDQFETGTNMRNWLYSIQMSIWKNDIRQSKNWNTIDISSLHDGLAGNERCRGESTRYFNQVLSDVTNLPTKQRDVVMLVSVEGLSYKEAASALSIPVGTVMSRLAQARLTLGKLHKSSKTELEHVSIDGRC